MVFKADCDHKIANCDSPTPPLGGSCGTVGLSCGAAMDSLKSYILEQSMGLCAHLCESGIAGSWDLGGLS